MALLGKRNSHCQPRIIASHRLFTCGTQLNHKILSPLEIAVNFRRVSVSLWERPGFFTPIPSASAFEAYGSLRGSRNSHLPPRNHSFAPAFLLLMTPQQLAVGRSSWQYPATSIQHPVYCGRQFAIRNSQFAIRNSQFTIHNPASSKPSRSP